MLALKEMLPRQTGFNPKTAPGGGVCILLMRRSHGVGFETRSESKGNTHHRGTSGLQSQALVSRDRRSVYGQLVLDLNPVPRPVS